MGCIIAHADPKNPDYSELFSLMITPGPRHSPFLCPIFVVLFCKLKHKTGILRARNNSVSQWCGAAEDWSVFRCISRRRAQQRALQPQLRQWEGFWPGAQPIRGQPGGQQGIRPTGVEVMWRPVPRRPGTQSSSSCPIFFFSPVETFSPHRWSRFSPMLVATFERHKGVDDCGIIGATVSSRGIIRAWPCHDRQWHIDEAITMSWLGPNEEAEVLPAFMVVSLRRRKGRMARGYKWSQWVPSGVSHTHCWARQCCLMECKYAPLTCPLTSSGKAHHAHWHPMAHHAHRQPFHGHPKTPTAELLYLSTYSPMNHWHLLTYSAYA